MTSPRESGIRAKVEWAKKHIRDVDTIVQSFRDSDPYGVRVEDDSQTGDKIQRLHFRSLIPAALPLAVGDAIHNLRAALDHLVRQLVLANTGTPIDGPGGTQFPMSQNAAAYHAALTRKVQGVSPAAQSLLESVQPYQSGYSDLAILHELDIIDKHHLQLSPAFALRSLAVKVDLRRGTGQKVVAQLSAPVGPGFGGRFVMLQDGAEIGRILAGTSPEQQQNLKPTFEIAFAEPQVVEGKPVLILLADLAGLVDQVVNLLAPELI
jgi:hypothetical protein